MRAKAKSSSTPYPIWIEGEYITEPPIRPSDGAVRPAGHYIDEGGYPGANVYTPLIVTDKKAFEENQHGGYRETQINGTLRAAGGVLRRRVGNSDNREYQDKGEYP